MKKINLFLTIGALLLATNTWAAHGSHFSKAIVVTTGNGKVYVSAQQTDPSSIEWSESTSGSSKETNAIQCANDNDNITFYLYAQPDDNDYVLEGWYNNAGCTGEPILRGTETSTTITASSKDSNSPTTQTFYAKFVQDYTKSAFYIYVYNTIKNATDEATANTALSGATNQASTEAALDAFRASLTSSLIPGKDLTGLLENPNFDDHPSDWNYGWTGANDETHTGLPGSWGGEGDPMNGYQKYEDNSNVYARMYRGNDALYSFTLAAGNVYQNITLPGGYYRLHARVKCNSNNDNVNLTDTLYVRDNGNKIGSYETKCAKNSSFKDAEADFAINGNTTLTIGNSHNELGGTATKEVAVDNFGLTYVCSKATYDAYMAQYDRATTLKDDVKLPASTRNALIEAQKDINILANAEAIVAQTTALSNACDAAVSAIAWVENNAVVVNASNVYVYGGENFGLGRGANYNTRAIVGDNGVKVNIATDSNTKIATITFTDTSKKLFVTNDNNVYTDYNDSGSYNFYLRQENNGGYTIVLANDLTKALGVTKDTYNEVWYDVVMPENISAARIWHFVDYKVNLQVSGTAKWGTFVAPFDVTVPSGVKAYTVEHEGSNAWLTRTELATSTIHAGTPVLLEQEGSETISQTYYGSLVEAVDNSGVLKGVYELTDVAANDNNYLLQYQNDECAFYLVDAAKQLGAYRCYLHLDNALAPARLDLSQPNEVATALPIVDASANATKILVNGKIVIVRNNKAFDLNGMLVK